MRKLSFRLFHCGALLPNTAARLRNTWTCGATVGSGTVDTWVRPPFQRTCVRSAAGSISTVSIRRKSQFVLVAGCAMKSGSTNTSASPTLRLLATPFTHVSVAPRPGARGADSHGRIAFHAGRAEISSTVSKVCGFSSGPGTLCTCSPAANVNPLGMPVTNAPGSGGKLAGAIFGVSRANASQVSAATPGRKR